MKELDGDRLRQATFNDCLFFRAGLLTWKTSFCGVGMIR